MNPPNQPNLCSGGIVNVQFGRNVTVVPPSNLLRIL